MKAFFCVLNQHVDHCLFRLVNELYVLLCVRFCVRSRCRSAIFEIFVSTKTVNRSFNIIKYDLIEHLNKIMVNANDHIRYSNTSCQTM